jgi:hypothetical protein
LKKQETLLRVKAVVAKIVLAMWIIVAASLLFSGYVVISCIIIAILVSFHWLDRRLPKHR